MFNTGGKSRWHFEKFFFSIETLVQTLSGSKMDN